MKLFWVMLIICIVILFGPSILKYMGMLFDWLYKIISLTGYKGVI